VPAPVVGMRKVTEAVAQMVVNTLLGSNQQSALSIQPEKIYHGDTEARRAAEEGSREASFRETRRRTRIAEGEITQCGVDMEGDLGPSLAVKSPLVQDDGLRRGDFAPRGVDRSKPVMGGAV
jgi:hypothetical protein